MTTPLFPGGVAVSDLHVYDEETVDGLCGGSPHLHTASSEGYVVTAGTGSVHTIDRDGAAVHPLEVGRVLWFSPGTVHRLVNDGGLQLLVVMQNSGLPEAGDAVLTFPDAILDDPEGYRRAATLPSGSDADRALAARQRRDLATEGYLELLAALDRDGPAALDRFHQRAARLVQPRVASWRTLWERTVAAETARTGAQLDALDSGSVGMLGEAAVRTSVSEPGERGYGMCGRLRIWNWTDGEQ